MTSSRFIFCLIYNKENVIKNKGMCVCNVLKQIRVNDQQWSGREIISKQEVPRFVEIFAQCDTFVFGLAKLTYSTYIIIPDEQNLNLTTFLFTNVLT